MPQFPFHLSISFIVFVTRCLEVTFPLTVQLQHSAFDAGSAREKGSCLYVRLEKVRNEVDVRHTRWFEEAESLAESVGTLPEKRPSSNIQTFQVICHQSTIEESLAFHSWIT